jgi:DNA-binding transcriptional regulator YdaS (Cro superfamily)
MNASTFIEALGGTAVVAALTGVKPPSVSGWKESGRIPDDKLIRLAPIAEARGIATRKELFPTDFWAIWPELAEPKGTVQEAKAA